MVKKSFLTVLFFAICTIMVKAQILDNYVIAGKQLLYSGEVNFAFESFSRGVRYNNMNARYFLGLCHEQGYGTNVNHQEAFNQFRRSAEGGNDKAKTAVANMLLHGTGCAKNLEKAKYWIEKLLMHSNDGGFFMKGVCQLEGVIYPQNTSDALANIQKSINAGNADACIYLANQLIEGNILSRDPQKALELVNHACNTDPTNILLQDKKGEILLKMGDNDGAKNLWSHLVSMSPAYAIEFNSAFSNTMRSKYAASASTQKAYKETREQKLALIEGGLQNNRNTGNNQTAQNNSHQQQTVIVQQPVFVQQPAIQQPVTQAPVIVTEQALNDNRKNNDNKKEKILSDVDKNIPAVQRKNEKTFAVIIANEHYQDVSQVPFANRDGEVFATYCKKALGLPESNVHFVKDATLNNIKRELNWIRQVADAYGKEAKVIFYYAGHGIPDEKTKAAYLLPIDGYGTDVSTGFSLGELYSTLGKLPTEQIIVLLDACFSGSQRGEGMIASARGIAIKPKEEAPQGKMVVLSAAQGDETAYPYESEGHGLFTYYLLKKLQETKGQVSFGELSSYIIDNVSKKSIVVNGKRQTPSVSSPASMGNEWKMWKMY